MRWLIAVFSVASLLLAGCPGSVMQPLPPGGGQGKYLGRFTNEFDTAVLGAFELEISNVGVVTGEGVLNGRAVDIEGILVGDEIDAYISDALIATSGRFGGQRTGSGYIGEFNLDQGPGADDFYGFWDCAPDPEG